jgi:hypothetical protein
VKLDNASFLVRLLRRFGRFAIAILSVGACLFVGGAVYYFIGSPKLTVYAGFGAGMGVYAIFDKLNLIPEDPDKLITLSLTTLPPADKR